MCTHPCIPTREAWCNCQDQFVYPDEGASYERVIEIDLSDVPLTVASPGDSETVFLQGLHKLRFTML